MTEADKNTNLREKDEVSDFLSHLSQGRVCAHPTDTIPGLTCDPRNAKALQSLEEIKKRTQKKAFVGLVPSLDRALDFWEPLPEFWRVLLNKIWPQSISFVWKARTNVPACLLSESGELALRYPRLDPEAEWYYQLMNELDTPLPSTSINYEGQPPISSIPELEEFCKQHSVYVPKDLPSHSGKGASSVLRIIDEDRFEWLRVGAFSEEEFDRIYSSLKK